MDPVPEILFVDDNPSESELVEEAFRHYQMPVSLRKVDTGPKALAYLHSTLEAGGKLPDLVLLDLNLPLLSGHEVLQSIRADARLKDLPVVILSSSDRRHDIERSEALGATSYVIKPTHWDEYLVLVRSFQQRLKQRLSTPG